MRHIKKNEPCQDFDNYIKQNNLNKYLDNYINNVSERKHTWDKLGEELKGREVKRELRNHLLKEQKGLCVYCQQSFVIAMQNNFLSGFSHIEHIKPKSRKSYPQDTFNQRNLSLSCNGFDCSKEVEASEFCGHKKLNEYDSSKFLNPIEIENIEKYFEYTFNGEIRVSETLNRTEKEKAEYMIDILDLKNSILSDMRRDTFTDIITNYSDKEISFLLDENSEILPSFYSMLKQMRK